MADSKKNAAWRWRVSAASPASAQPVSAPADTLEVVRLAAEEVLPRLTLPDDEVTP